MLALETKGLRKTFRVKRKEEGLSGSFRSLFRPDWQEHEAVKGIDLTVQQGETVAFLGPNGAGKSTTIKMLTGILHPSSGEAQVLGLTPWKERNRLAFRIGAVFGQKSQLWYHLPPVDTFELISTIYELDRRTYRKRRDELVERFELGPYLRTPVRKLSLGERMRCEIAASFLHGPQLLFLDEPTIGLDAVVKARIRDLIKERNREEGTTVFLTSHDADDVEQLCSRAIVIHHGGVLMDEPVGRMKRDILVRKTVTLTLAEGESASAFPDIEGTERMHGTNGAKGTTDTTDTTGINRPTGSPGLSSFAVGDRADRTIRLQVDLNRIGIDDVLGKLIGKVRLSDVSVEDPPLEEIIKHLYANRGGEAAK